ncbi:tyrosyl-DNA phosphodiesterase 1 [Chytridiales sp. JEL 0842]|nr:tyrosyl-DNA phosphodiesterase 1 [Chytridiales sp. JEL 0842]
MKRTAQDGDDDDDLIWSNDSSLCDHAKGSSKSGQALSSDKPSKQMRLSTKEEAAPGPSTSTNTPLNLDDYNWHDSGVKLTTVFADPDPVTNINTVSLADILKDGGPIETMYQFNYMLDLEYFLANMPDHSVNCNMNFVVHKDPMLVEISKACPENWKFIFPYVEQFGTHHTKAMFLFYKNSGTAKVVIHTANLIERDWGQKSQAAWISDVLLKKSDKRPLGPNATFEKDLLDYIGHYGHNLRPLRDLISQYDFSHVKAKLIGSVPGRHKASGGAMRKWGYLKLAEELKKVRVSEDCLAGSTLLLQFSSCGSLGNDDSWLTKDFGEALSSASNRRQVTSKPKMKIVFPTSTEVQNSNQGWSGGNSIPVPDRNWQRQKHYMRPLLHRWKAINAGRSDCMPHIKTFARLSEQTGDLSWIVVGSHNLSKAAWGALEVKGSQLFIRSYELGVLIYPDLFQPKVEQTIPSIRMINLTPREQQKVIYESHSDKKDKHAVHIRLPYDLPLTPYTATDEPWRVDVAFPGLDRFGNRRE